MLTPDLQQWIEATLAHYGQVASALLRRTITVEVLEGLNTGAMGDGDKLYIGAGFIKTMVGDIEGKSVSAFKATTQMRGLIYHELGHALYTDLSEPHINHYKAPSDAAPAGCFSHFNLLEDHRIERLIIARFPSMAKYLTSVVLRYAIRLNDLTTAWPYVCGRTYLPEEVRAEAMVTWDEGHDIGRWPADAETVFGIVEEYITEYKRHTGWAWRREITERFAAAIEFPPEDFDLHQSVKPKGMASDKKNPDKATAGSMPPPPSHGKGKGGGSGGAKSMGKKLDEAIKENDADEEVQQQATKDVRNIGTLARRYRMPTPRDFRHGTPYTSKVDDETKALSAQVLKVLRPIVESAAPRRIHRQDSGDLNPLHYRTRPRGASFNVFDRYKPGQRQATSIEIIQAIDISGSALRSADGEPLLDHRGVEIPYQATWGHKIYENYVRGTITERSFQAAWAVKRAVDQLPEADCRVWAWDDQPNVADLYPHGSRTETFNQWPCNYGTDPGPMLRLAAGAFDASQRANKLLVIYTDGEWFGGWQEGGDPIANMKKAGVLTMLIGLGGETVKNHGGHGCDIAVDMDGHIMAIPLILRTVVARMLQARLAS